VSLMIPKRNERLNIFARFKIAPELSSSVITRIGLFLLQFYTVRIYVQRLGIDDYATWVSFVTALLLLVGLEVALANSLRNMGASIQVNKGREKCREIFINLFSVGLACATFIAVIVFFLGHFLINPIDGSLGLVISYLPFYFLWFPLAVIRAYGYIEDVGQYNFLQQFLSVFITLVLFVGFYDFEHWDLPNIEKMVIFYGISHFISHIPLMLKLNILPNKRLVFSSAFKEIVLIKRQILSFIGIQIVFFVLFSVDRIFIYMLSDSVSVVSFDVISKLTNCVVVFSGVYYSIKWVKLSRALQLKDMAYLDQFLKRTSVVILLAFIVLMLMSPLIDVLFNLWLGTDVVKFGVTGVILLAVACMQSFGGVSSTICNSSGIAAHVNIQSYLSLIAVGIKLLVIIISHYLLNIAPQIFIPLSTLMACSIWGIFGIFYIRKQGLVSNILFVTKTTKLP
jgi:O-antigen/teichoic acid export membrane protein